MKTLPLLLGTVAAFAVTTAMASRADACWDGYAASVRDVSLSVPGDDTWKPETARALARWGTRIGALLPKGTKVDVEFGSVTVCTAGSDGACGATIAETRWENGELSSLFSKVATATHASRETLRRALDADATPLTVQVFAASTRPQAEAFAKRINESDAGAHGFYTAGGFPARNPAAHVMVGADAAGRKVFRVVMGAFLARGEADLARDALKHAIGVEGFARPL